MVWQHVLVYAECYDDIVVYVVFQIQVYEDKVRKLQVELKRMQELNQATDDEVSEKNLSQIMCVSIMLCKRTLCVARRNGNIITKILHCKYIWVSSIAVKNIAPRRPSMQPGENKTSFITVYVCVLATTL